MFPFRKAKKNLLRCFDRFQKKKNRLPEDVRENISKALEAVQTCILEKDRKGLKEAEENLQILDRDYLRRGFVGGLLTSILSLLLALVVAIIIRQSWWELYQIPSGSMRPTFQEKDMVLVSKTTFGINIPLIKDHFYFDPDLVKRNGIVVFTGDGLDMADPDTLYFWVIPGKKQMVKRLIGKPGDTLYFYGGRAYGIDRYGRDISSELQLPRLSNINHVPMISFEGRVKTPSKPIHEVFSPAVIYQTNIPVAKMVALPNKHVHGEMLPLAGGRRLPKFDDLWGMKNFGQCRLLSEDKYHQFSGNAGEKGHLYLEITHHPNLKHAKLMHDLFGRLRPMLGTYTSYVDLNETLIHRLMKKLTTSRFVVTGGKVTRFGRAHNSFDGELSNVPDGTYEFYQGKAYKVLPGGFIRKLSDDHPLYTVNEDRALLFYNLGMEFDTRFAPKTKFQTINPSRFAYFRNENLYLMDLPFLKPDDREMVQFIHNEYAKQAAAPSFSPYAPFEDLGPPLNSEGHLDIELIKRQGLTVPQGHYFVLGDNYANSGDSRDFGFVPQENLKGAPSLIFFPFGNRWGFPNQPHYAFLTFPNLLVWAIFIFIAGMWYAFFRKKSKLPLSIK